ncbi:hypothetical protein A3D78_03290 [Candidatus Gottesmanbacteria bacterium RIFCSPHIGHO2_02_FULL_39_14]|uniref:Uncharacterized protein n=3 Tax=Candidatus Gottesmaniibacteriota TaxID=1752720 RepID=A0A1F5ZUD2_9BACT|nr:MAG: hypothetical protein A2153_03980 [Candidatus Gottesmanbacteria bacterium RBG_16_38_7b]OGG15954.1 MAG: hypothetical protein A3D78_03290 [Candidatus Gottesmanbacteria bacterium RIFCSPHIGHO2_02_FULL_39_14]OGG31101.1 MAG: hypothetical protein A3I51_05690 [Candidatus Gottesmanbacteria bacterium RIFCSPLOWO2_02_FULL_38_8]
MDDLFEKYKQRINSLPISEEEKDKLFNNFATELQFNLTNAFADTLTDEQLKKIDEAVNDEETLRIYFSILNESLELPEFLDFIEQTYTDIMTKTLSSLPEFTNQPSLK